MAQEQPKEPEPEQASAPDARPHIQVLRHPYDIASFYRAAGSARGFSYGSYADPYGSYTAQNDSGVPLGAYRPDLRGRYFGPRWDSEFDGSNPAYQLDGWGTRRRFPRRPPADEGQPARQAPVRP